MKITIEAQPKEIAAFALAIQERQPDGISAAEALDAIEKLSKYCT